MACFWMLNKYMTKEITSQILFRLLGSVVLLWGVQRVWFACVLQECLSGLPGGLSAWDSAAFCERRRASVGLLGRLPDSGTKGGQAASWPAPGESASQTGWLSLRCRWKEGWPEWHTSPIRTQMGTVGRTGTTVNMNEGLLELSLNLRNTESKLSFTYDLGPWCFTLPLRPDEKGFVWDLKAETSLTEFLLLLKYIHAVVFP